MQRGDYQWPLNGLAAISSVLEGYLSLVEKHYGLVELLAVDAAASFEIEVLQFFGELVWVEAKVPSSLTSSNSSDFGSAISFLRVLSLA